MEKIDISQEARTKVVTLDKGQLRRRLGLLDIIGVSYGDVGSSIIYALGVVTAFALGATPLAIAIAGCFFICTALTYAELGATIPQAGGAQIFARRAFNDLISFIAGWALLLDYVLTAAISAYTIGPYLAQFLPFLQKPVWILATASGLMIFLAALNIVGIKESSRVSVVLSALCVGTLLVLIVWGFATVFNPSQFVGQIKIGSAPTWPMFLNGLILSMVAYIGIESATQLSGETRNPGHVLPKAIKWIIGTVLVLHLGITAVAMCAMSPFDLGSIWQEQPLVGVAKSAVGNWMAAWIGILAAIILFVATNAGLIGASRLAYSMSVHLQLPRPFQLLHSRRRTPWVALIFFTLAAIGVLCATRNMKALAELYNFGSMLAFALAHLSLVGLRIKEPNLERPYKLPLNFRIRGRQIPVTALIGLLATGATWVAVVVLHPMGRWLGLAWVGLGLLMYFAIRRRQEIPLVDSVRIERVSMPEFKPWQVKRVLIPTLGGKDTESVQIACRVAREHGAELVVLYVIEIPEALPLETFLVDPLQRGDEALARAEAIGREVGITTRPKLLQARAAGPTICEVAKEEQCDLIILGAPKRPGPGFSLGRTVETVLRHAPCHVWVCK